MVRLEPQLLSFSFLLVWNQLPFHSQCEHGDRRKAGHWGNMGRGPLFPCIAYNELRQPLMGSLTRATRWNRSPSWQSGQAGCLTLYESLIRVWARPVQLAQALCMMLIRRQSPQWLLEVGVPRGCLDLPFDPRANQH